ncbi:MAG: amidohydrolase family protein, partial [Clostridia bacterium]|nr:amidohydrolase family protein [Clostridia bacterium]
LYATLPTTSIDELYSALENYREFDKKYSNTTVAGLHLEGPWFNPAQCGAQDTSNMLTPNPNFLRELKNKYPFIKHVAAAPELENGYEFGNTGKELGIVMSAGHTDASFSEIERAFESGYTGMTHLYSGMKGVTRKNSFRIAGAVEGGLYIDGMFVEIIADGRHLPYELLRFIFKFKGEDKIMLVTDATRAAGLPNGTESVVGSLANGTPIIIEDEVAKLHDRQSFAGSIATADRLFRTMAEAIGKNWVALMKMSSYVPAHFMGLDDRGEIAVGKLADLVIIDENCNLKKVIKGGIEADVRSTQ